MEESGYIRLTLGGLSANEVHRGAYALLLSEVDGDKTIPVIIGVAEAQSIAASLEKANLSRPLSHDIFVSSAKAFGIKIESVLIYKFDKGVFYSEIKMKDGYTGDRDVIIDSRTSDAVAIALRCNAPIFAVPEVVEETGILSTSLFNINNKIYEEPEPDIPLSRYSIEELERMMKACVEKEDYEQAAVIKQTIEEKKNKK